MVFETPFPPWCGFSVVRVDEPDATPVHPEEAALAPPRAIPRRHQELAAGRRAARRALAAAGCVDPRPILKGDRGQPLWPPGWVGAITHAEAYAAAVVAPRALSAGVGLDLESLDRKVEQDIARIIALPEEQAWIGQDKARLLSLFSAKEAIFKAMFPLEHVFLDFVEARVQWIEAESRFEAELLRAASRHHPIGYHFPIQVQRAAGYVLAAVVLPP